MRVPIDLIIIGNCIKGPHVSAMNGPDLAGALLSLVTGTTGIIRRKNGAPDFIQN
jgi:hypothetical protein